ncbi:hypothetical protein SDC9_54024 [bioreactor metagenome]|uniref:Uncharacterized protein n=1 Tax=bioreactor metagenome TaxID=1076179 RepID=A0A644WVL3_9ZZZZ
MLPAAQPPEPSPGQHEHRQKKEASDECPPQDDLMAAQRNMACHDAV